MNTKPCMSSHNKWIIILIYTKDCSDTEGYKNQTWRKNFVAQKMAASEVLSAQCINWIWKTKIKAWWACAVSICFLPLSSEVEPGVQRHLPQVTWTIVHSRRLTDQSMENLAFESVKIV